MPDARRTADHPVSLATVNIATVALGARLDEAGFRHRATAVGERVGAARIGAGVYEAEAGFPIWPYHYHHGVEEWLYVISGAPVLRAPAGERTLKPGDLVCFPAGYEGAHTVSGPGRCERQAQRVNPARRERVGCGED